MTALQLNAELFKELSYIADNENYVIKVLNYIKRLRQSSNATDNKQGVEQDLDELLHMFNNDEITQRELDAECEKVREEIYHAK
ncbi:MAG: hypothetical protein J6M30_06365 [Bacteroidales bacterium]|nr:hypothetical protein [Bacteroidales bacterium]